MTLRIVKKAPGEEPAVVEIDDTLEAMQAVVEGPIELVRWPGLDLYCNEVGKLEELEPNIFLDESWLDVICGTVFVSACDADGEQRSLTPDEVKTAVQRLNDLDARR